MLTSLKLLALMAITTSLLAQPTSADHSPGTTFYCREDNGQYDVFEPLEDGDFGFLFTGEVRPVTTPEFAESLIVEMGHCGDGETFNFDHQNLENCCCQLDGTCVAREAAKPTVFTCDVDDNNGVAYYAYPPLTEFLGTTPEDVENHMKPHCAGGERFNYDLEDQEKCGCVVGAKAAPPTGRPYVFLGKAEAAGAMKSAYLAYTSALNGSLQHYIEDAARRLVEEARGSTERVCVVLVDLLRAGLNSELVDLEDFTDFYGKVIEELGCSDV